MSDSATPSVVACQAPLSVGFPTQEDWSGLPFPLPGDLPDLGIKPRSPTLQAEALPLSHQGIPMKGNVKQCSNFCTIALISHTSKVVLKILQARLQQYMNHELPDVQAGFKRGRGTRDQIANICWITEKARELQKSIYFCCIDYAKAFDCVDHNKL